MPEEAKPEKAAIVAPVVDAVLTARVAELEREIERINKIMRNHAIY